jgi:hypothetical protein
MPTKKLKRDTAPAKPPPRPPQQDKRAGKQSESANGLTGQGADSVLAHLIEQEKARGRKSGRS